MRGIVLQPVTPTAKAALAQQLACWAKTASNLTDVGVRYGTCCVSPTGQTLGRWTIPPGLCDTYGELPFTSRGQAIPCDTDATQLTVYYIYDTDVTGIDPDTCVPVDPGRLPTPTGLVATLTGDTSINLAWDAVADATGYTVTIWPTDAPDQAETRTVTTPGTDFTDLAAQTAYTMQVVAIDGTGAHLPSAPAQTTATTPGAEQLDAPTGLTAEAATTSSVALSWTASPQADGYTVSWALAADPGTVLGTDTTTGLAYDVTGLDAGTDYIVFVVATDSTGARTDSAPASLTLSTELPSPLAAPTLDNVTITDTQASTITVTVDYASGTVPQGAAFTLEPGGHSTTVAYPDTSADFSGLDQDVEYTYTVIALGDGQDTGDSAPLTGSFTYAGVQEPPTNVTATAVAPTSVTVNWAPAAGVGDYRAQLTIGQQDGPIASGIAPVSSPIQLDDLEPGTVYVPGVSSLGQETSFSTANPTLVGDSDPAYGAAVTTPLEAPANVTSSAVTDDSATVSWDAVTGAESYTVSWALTSDPGSPVGSDTTTALSYDITGLDAETGYTVTVVAEADGIPESAPGTAQFTTEATPQLPAPTGLATTDITPEGATVTWGAVAGADGYTVSWALAADPGSPVGSDTTASTTYDITGLDAETDYIVTVVATDSTGGHTDSEAATVPFTTAAPPVLPTPSGLDAGTPTTTSATVTWGAVAGADGYTVSWALATDPDTPVGTESVTGTSHTIADLVPGTDYVVAVVATDSTGDAADSEAGTVSFTTAVPPALAAPTLDNVTITDPGAGIVTISVDVDADPNGTRYTLNPGDQTTTQPSGSANASFSGVSEATTYTYTAAAIGDGTNNLDSPDLTGTFTYAGELPDPANVSADPVSATAATIAWDAVTGADSYVLTVVNDAEPADTVTITGALSPQEVDSLAAETDYTATVMAVGTLTATTTSGPVLGTDSLGEASAQFTTGVPEEGEALAAPTGLAVSAVTALGATLTWEPVEGAEEYTVSWALALTPEVQLGSDTTTEPSYGLLGLLASTLYVVTVTAHAAGRVDSSGVSVELETAFAL